MENCHFLPMKKENISVSKVFKKHFRSGLEKKSHLKSYSSTKVNCLLAETSHVFSFNLDRAS